MTTLSAKQQSLWVTRMLCCGQLCGTQPVFQDFFFISKILVFLLYDLIFFLFFEILLLLFFKIFFCFEYFFVFRETFLSNF